MDSSTLTLCTSPFPIKGCLGSFYYYHVFTDNYVFKANSVDPDQTKHSILFANIPLWNARHKLFVCVEVLRPSQPNEVMSSAVSLPNHTFTGQA